MFFYYKFLYSTKEGNSRCLYSDSEDYKFRQPYLLPVVSDIREILLDFLHESATNKRGSSPLSTQSTTVPVKQSSHCVQLPLINLTSYLYLLPNLPLQIVLET
ncbi:hypothetical protein AVEN_95990-1 [Araneus ventricosus]|uniref:Uncharacterized protein n=1 Tax=Araneus ventricosus TaxID=182803 RepID=A0A4Y2B327_ARAVE|nr:hypothetical protein AVEN_95990-1 [Araneus ventricosus]